MQTNNMELEKPDKLGEVNTVIDEKTKLYFTDVFSPGETKEQLRIGKEVKEIATTSSIFAWSVTYTTTGVKTVSGVGFTPRLIKIHACLATGSISDWVYFNGAVTCNYYFTGGGAWDASGNVWYSSYLDNAGNATYTTTVTPTTDWFTINVFTVAWGAVTIIYECYG